MSEFLSDFIPAFNASIPEIEVSLLWFVLYVLFGIWFCWRVVFKPFNGDGDGYALLLYIVGTVVWSMMFVPLKVGGAELLSIPDEHHWSYICIFSIGAMWLTAIVNIILSTFANYLGYRWKLAKGLDINMIANEIATNMSWPLNSLAVSMYATGAGLGGFVVSNIYFPVDQELSKTSLKLIAAGIILIGAVIAVVGSLLIRKIPPMMTSLILKQRR